jgi:hypothetical protein
MKTFSEAEAGAALSGLARARLRDLSIKPTDVCLFAWLAAEAARENVNPIQTTAADMLYGFDWRGNGMSERIEPVGLALNTIKASITRLEETGFITIQRTPSTSGQKLEIEIRVGSP